MGRCGSMVGEVAEVSVVGFGARPEEVIEPGKALINLLGRVARRSMASSNSSFGKSPSMEAAV